MKERTQVTIGINRDKFETLKIKKDALEMTLARRVDWGSFFLMLASQRSVKEIADSVEEKSLGLSLDYEKILSSATRDDVKEIVDTASDRITDRVVSELKKHLSKPARKKQ